MHKKLGSHARLEPEPARTITLCLSANASNVIPFEAGEKIVKVAITLEA